MQVCYDYHVDYDLFEELMLAGASKPTATLVPTHVGYLNRDPAGELASQQCFTTLRSERNLMQYHALADALALRAKGLFKLVERKKTCEILAIAHGHTETGSIDDVSHTNLQFSWRLL